MQKVAKHEQKMAQVVGAKIQFFSEGSVGTGVGNLRGSSVEREHAIENSAH